MEIEQKFKLTCKGQLSKHCKDGKDRNFLYYFLNDVLILKQKIPFDIRWERGCDRVTGIYDDYLLNGKLYQTRSKKQWNSSVDDVRQVYFPISKKVLAQFNIPKDLKIDFSEEPINN
jgi:hypothetical protein